MTRGVDTRGRALEEAIAGLPDGPRKDEILKLVAQQRDHDERGVSKGGDQQRIRRRTHEVGQTDAVTRRADKKAELKTDADTKRGRAARRKPRIPARLRPLPLADGTKSPIAPNTYPAGHWKRLETDPHVLAAARRLHNDLHDLAIGRAYDDLAAAGPYSGTAKAAPRQRFCTPAMRDAVLEAHRIAYGITVEDTWREILMGQLLIAKIAMVETEQKVPPIEGENRARVADPVRILASLRTAMVNRGLPCPVWLTAPVVAWLLGRYNPGGGGGEAKKLSEAAVDALLREPLRLADAIEETSQVKLRSKRKRAARAPLAPELRQPLRALAQSIRDAVDTTSGTGAVQVASRLHGYDREPETRQTSKTPRATSRRGDSHTPR